MALFVTLEGIDGAGKSTLARSLVRRLQEAGVDVIRTKEPTSSWLGDAVRRAVDEDDDPRVQTLLFLADRGVHVERITRWLSEGKVVLCDRFQDSTLAYQRVALEGKVDDPRDWLERASSFITLEPDLTLLLLVDPAEGLSRISATRARSPFERTAFLTRVQEVYEELARSPRFVNLDASLPRPKLAQVAEETVLARLQA